MFKKRILMMLLAISAIVSLRAQSPVFDGATRIKVAVLAPVYLDSLFGATGYKYGKEVPRFTIPALDFMQGAMVAFDSIKLENTTIDAYFFDTRSYTKPLSGLVRSQALDSMDLLIGSVRDAEYKMLADLALQKNIPFISATFPNDGGVTQNPFLVIMNSTLKAHCEAIYAYLLQEHPTDKIYLCRRSGTQDDRIPSLFRTLNEQEGKPLLNIEILQDDSALDVQSLMVRLDSNRKTVFIGASLDENFALNLATTCASLEEPFHIKLIGMPNWDGFGSLRNKKNEKLKNFSIHFTTPYFNNKWDEYSKKLSSRYLRRYNIKPSDMAFKGFESVWLFTRLMVKHPNDFMSNLNDKSAKVICDYNFKPVRLKKESSVPDYFENKHVYFIKLMNGEISRAW